MAWWLKRQHDMRCYELQARDELLMTDETFDDQQSEYGSDYGVNDSFGPDDMGQMQTAVASAPETQSGQGPCLYLGPAGQRCYRRAVTDSFCAQHQPGATAIKRVAKPAKWVAAIAGMLGVLWPYIYDFLHELFRIFHPR
jgi:hypothetical protein